MPPKSYKGKNPTSSKYTFIPVPAKSPVAIREQDTNSFPSVAATKNASKRVSNSRSHVVESDHSVIGGTFSDNNSDNVSRQHHFDPADPSSSRTCAAPMDANVEDVLGLDDEFDWLADYDFDEDTIVTDSDIGKRRYALPKKRKPGETAKTVYIFDDILRPDCIPRWYAPEIRLRFTEFWETFDMTTNEFRDNMWKGFKQWYIVPEDIHDAVHKLFLEQLGRCYGNFVARMKREALQMAELQVASPRLLKYPPVFLKNRLLVWRDWVKYWCGEKQMKISEINSNNRKVNGGMGTHVGGSKSHTRSISQIVDVTGERPSIAKRLRMQYGKKDESGNPTPQMVNNTSAVVMDEWVSAVKASHGEEVDPEDVQDPDLYLSLKTVAAGKKKGRIFAYGSTKHAYIKLKATPQQHSGSDSNPSQEIMSDEALIQQKAGEEEKKKLLDEVDRLKSLVSQQDKKIDDFDKVVKYLLRKQDSGLSVLDIIQETQPTPNDSLASTDLHAPANNP